MTETPGGGDTPGGLDDRGRRGPCDGAYLTAWNLWAQRLHWKDAVEKLSELGHAVGCSVGPHSANAKLIGRATFYDWRDKGRELALEGNELELAGAQQLQLATINTTLAMAYQRINEYPHELWVGLPQIWRGVREYAQLAGTDAPRRTAVTLEQATPPVPDLRQRAVVADAEATAAAERDARRAGAWPDEQDRSP